MAAVDRGEVTLVESTSILAEVVPEHTRDTELHRLARDSARALLESPTTEFWTSRRTSRRKAGELKAALGLNTWDAVHLATGILAAGRRNRSRPQFPQG